MYVRYISLCNYIYIYKNKRYISNLRGENFLFYKKFYEENEMVSYRERLEIINYIIY